MAPIRDHFLDLERHRVQLEQNVAKLRKALDHWRMADAEYEELKEDVEALPETATRDDYERVQHEFEGRVITDNEVAELFGQGAGSHAKIVTTLRHRIDYVTKNVATLEKQLERAEEKYAAATIITNPDVRDEDGLPITDIVESLDDEDQVTSFRLQRPGDVQPQIREALAKAGIKDLPEGNPEAGPSDGGINGSRVEDVTDHIENTSVEILENEQEPERSPSNSNQHEMKPKSQPEIAQSPTRKAVSFAEDTKPGHGSESNGEQPVSRTAERLEEIMHQARQQAIPAESPVIPEDESDDDAELRREMLRYGMTDIAPIVAELEVDEEGDSEYDEAYSDADEDYDYDDNEEDEDQYGRSKYGVVDNKYRRRMQELEAKLGIKSSREIEEGNNGTVADEGIARIAVQAPTPNKSAMRTDKDQDTAQEAKPIKKGVKFAPSLDVAPDREAEQPALVAEEPKQPFVDPMASTIVERSPAAQPAAPGPSEPKKASRFKKARTANSTDALPIRPAPTVPAGPANAPACFLDQDVRTVPAGPEGTTLANKILERDTPAEAREPDEFDAALLHQEAAVEYNLMRNRMIQKQGGFVREKEKAIEYPEEESEQAGKRISRFKAARLARQ